MKTNFLEIITRVLQRFLDKKRINTQLKSFIEILLIYLSKFDVTQLISSHFKLFSSDSHELENFLNI